MRGPCEKSGESEEQEKEVAAAATAAGRPAGVPEAEDSDTDSDSNLETEGASGQGLLGWSHLWGFFGRSGRDRLGSSRQELSPPWDTYSIAGGGNSLCLPYNAPGASEAPLLEHATE